MKKLFALLVAAAGMFLLTGCSDSPKDVAGKWVSAIVEGDAETANKYSTDNVKLINAILIDTVKKNDKKSQNIKDAQAKLKNAKEEINGDTAKVIIDDNKNNTITLKKVDGDWKVNVEK